MLLDLTRFLMADGMDAELDAVRALMATNPASPVPDVEQVRFALMTTEGVMAPPPAPPDPGDTNVGGRPKGPPKVPLRFNRLDPGDVASDWCFCLLPNDDIADKSTAIVQLVPQDLLDGVTVPDGAEGGSNSTSNSNAPPTDGVGGEKKWVYLDDSGAQQGPFSTTEMSDWFTGGFLAADRKVKEEGSSADFVDLSSIPELCGSESDDGRRTLRATVQVRAGVARLAGTSGEGSTRSVPGRDAGSDSDSNSNEPGDDGTDSEVEDLPDEDVPVELASAGLQAVKAARNAVGSSAKGKTEEGREFSMNLAIDIVITGIVQVRFDSI